MARGVTRIVQLNTDQKTKLKYETFTENSLKSLYPEARNFETNRFTNTCSHTTLTSVYMYLCVHIYILHITKIHALFHDIKAKNSHRIWRPDGPGK